MSFWQILKKNTQMRASLLTMLLSLVAVLSILLAMFQVTAWFVNTETATTDAVLTNFETTVQYAVNGSSSWTPLSGTNAIPIGVTYDSANSVWNFDTVQLEITYRGKSNAFLRVSAYGSFQNADTQTYLPQSDGLWTISGTNWQSSNGYWYYTQKVGCAHNETASVGSFTDDHTLQTLTVTLDSTKLAQLISPHQDYQGELYIHVDTVQPDRYQEFWNIDALPFSLS